MAKRNVANWVAERFKQAGARAEPEACARSSSSSATTSHALANEIDKLAIWAAGEPIGEREVELLVAAVAETPIVRAHRRVGAARLGRTLAASETIFEREPTSAPRDVAPPGRRARQPCHPSCARCQRLAAEGVRPRDAAAALKLHPFYVEKLFAQAANFSEDELRDAVVRLAALDHALKGGSRLAPDLELQRALVDLSAGGARARRLGRRRRGARRGPSCARRCSCAARRATRPCRSCARARGARRRPVRVPVGDGRLEPLRQRLDRRAVAQVLRAAARSAMRTRFFCC